MIDEGRTLYIYGYTSDELAPRSGKPIVAFCDECETYRDTTKHAYRELCMSCAQNKRWKDPKLHEKQSIAMKKRYEDPEEREKQSILMKKRYEDPEEHEKQSIAMSGENHPNWQGGISFGKYCPEFNSGIKQYIRDKYGDCDYISGLSSHTCNSHRKLDVHHIDYNKSQGCDEHEWRLIPLSRKNHMRTNYNRHFWNTLFTYSIQHDDEYYNEADKNLDVFSYINEHNNNIIGVN